MAVTPREYQDKRYYKDIQREPWRKLYQRAYIAGADATLSELGLERGDALPGNSDAVIYDAHIEVTKTGDRIAIVNAVELVAEA